jgi:REP element-mobilizing transposase RayT
MRDYDYSGAGAYFLTICSWNRGCLFGDIADGKMRLNEFGEIVKWQWEKTGIVRTNVELDEFQIMPNHFHGIIILNGNVGATRWVARFPETRQVAGERAIHRIAPTKDIPGARSGSIGAIIGQFKSIATKQINASRNTPGFPVWQRNYYEHIIRNNDEMDRIREYIINNPVQWAEDENNPSNINRRGVAATRP